MKGLTRIYLRFKKLKEKFEKLDPDIKEEDNEEINFWMKYEDKKIKYILLTNILEKSICKQYFKECKFECRKGKRNVFYCEYCEYGGKKHEA